MLPHFAGKMSKNYVAVLDLHAEHGVGEGFFDDALDLDSFFLGHNSSSEGLAS
jgi:hypothetical protein